MLAGCPRDKSLYFFLGKVYSVEVMGDKIIDSASLYRRAELERRLARGIVDGKNEYELSDMLGMPSSDVTSVIGRLADRVRTETAGIARIWAVKQTGALFALYLSLEKLFVETADPRYSTEMRGALKDIRDIHGVDSAKRVHLSGAVDVGKGVLGGIIGQLSEGELEQLAGIFEGVDGFGCGDGSSLSSSEEVQSVGIDVPLDRE